MKRTLQILNELERDGVLNRYAIGREMEAMDTLKPEIARLFAAKEARRHKLAALTFPEKVRVVVRLQEMAAPVLRARGKKARVWNLDDRGA